MGTQCFKCLCIFAYTLEPRKCIAATPEKAVSLYNLPCNNIKIIVGLRQRWTSRDVLLKFLHIPQRQKWSTAGVWGDTHIILSIWCDYFPSAVRSEALSLIKTCCGHFILPWRLQRKRSVFAHPKRSQKTTCVLLNLCVSACGGSSYIRLMNDLIIRDLLHFNV